MRIYSNCYELMSETARNLWEMGDDVRPNTYQNKDIRGNEDFITKELICEQYCLQSLDKVDALFAYDSRSPKWATLELIERVTPSIWPCNPGTAWKVRPELWEQFLVDGRFDYTYNERLWWKDTSIVAIPNNTPILTKVVNELRNNPDTRQALVPIYHPTDVVNIGGKKRVPCTVYYNFLIRRNADGEKQLNICYHQRSSDLITHFGNDVFLAFRLMEFVAKEVEVKPGYLYHTIDSLHSYKKDWDKLKTPINQWYGK